MPDSALGVHSAPRLLRKPARMPAVRNALTPRCSLGDVRRAAPRDGHCAKSTERLLLQHPHGCTAVTHGKGLCLLEGPNEGRATDLWSPHLPRDPCLSRPSTCRDHPHEGIQVSTLPLATPGDIKDSGPGRRPGARPSAATACKKSTAVMTGL
ncbi:hypothetical protein NDU88_005856 [Pleurodeles waltl]|uniref:Uncharacterized protein n=1 Tax=Pleurodeles waltl TaxID=8319 RepID=A0AAV7MBT4_PLEWA|nr:hypothetical protein NDU88_005856 [Pleurodeles waltl]